MMFHFIKPILSGFAISLLGLFVLSSLQVADFDIEENIGLSFLFKFRGAKPAPSDAVIVSLDKVSADYLNLPAEPRKWPHSLHTRLTENLTKNGASVIVFDIHFDESHSQKEDEFFAKAIQNAGNVVLCECLRKDIISLPTANGSQKGGFIHLETLDPPLEILAKSALALAPFPLPKVPVKVSQYWTFKTAAGETPTLPVVSYQIFALNEYNRLLSMLREIVPAQADKLPPNKDALIKARNVEKTVRTIRNIFKQQPSIALKMLKKVEISPDQYVAEQKTQRLISLIRMYQSLDSHFLNYYGPPGTITTIPFYQILEGQTEQSSIPPKNTLAGKAVFVGLSEQLRPEQKDGFYTVYSQPNGVDISGVEIAATAFANLLEDRSLQRLHVYAEAAVILIWGMILGISCRVFPAGISLAVVLALSATYLFFVRQQFSQVGIWWPVVLPLLFQAPLAFLGNLLWKNSEVNKERKHIRLALEYYLPDKVANQFAKNITDIKSNRQIVNGICLLTDAGRYTTLSDTLGPKELADFMHKYYEVLFKPVKDYDGIVINIVGDSMLALWESKSQELESKRRACLAALKIIRAVSQFNQSSGKLTLPTRIGIDYGRIMLGNIGAIHHYEYRPTGSAVSTASRLEGLNKILGTGVLASENALEKINGFLIRRLGVFLLRGKTVPTTVCELICRLEEATEKQRALCKVFAEGLNSYRGQSWDKAADLFQQCLEIFRQDGPASFYLKKCKQLMADPPAEGWDEVVRLTEK